MQYSVYIRGIFSRFFVHKWVFVEIVIKTVKSTYDLVSQENHLLQGTIKGFRSTVNVERFKRLLWIPIDSQKKPPNPL